MKARTLILIGVGVYLARKSSSASPALLPVPGSTLDPRGASDPPPSGVGLPALLAGVDPAGFGNNFITGRLQPAPTGGGFDRYRPDNPFRQGAASQLDQVIVGVDAARWRR